MHTLTTDQLAEPCCDPRPPATTPTEAAAQLVCGHRSLARPAGDFLAACVELRPRRHRPGRLDRLGRRPRLRRAAPLSSSEARILRLAAELAGVDTGVPLGDLLSGLDDGNARLVLDAIAHALTSGRPAMTAPTPTPGVVARWTTRRRPAAGDRCDECGDPRPDIACDGCGQLAGDAGRHARHRRRHPRRRPARHRRAHPRRLDTGPVRPRHPEAVAALSPARRHRPRPGRLDPRGAVVTADRHRRRRRPGALRAPAGRCSRCWTPAA